MNDETTTLHLIKDNRCELILNCSDRSFAAMRIISVYKAYGVHYDFIRFYADDLGNTLLCLQDELLVAAINDFNACQSVAELASVTANCVLSVMALPLCEKGYVQTRGNVYLIKNLSKDKSNDVTNDLQEGYNILSKVFSNKINGDTYHRWYAENSHRIRHGMSNIYVIAGKCSATAYAKSDDTIFLTELATNADFHKQGYAKKILCHMLADNEDASQILLLSLDEKSNNFYEHMGGVLISSWFYYEKREQTNEHIF